MLLATPRNHDMRVSKGSSRINFTRITDNCVYMHESKFRATLELDLHVIKQLDGTQEFEFGVNEFGHKVAGSRCEDRKSATSSELDVY